MKKFLLGLMLAVILAVLYFVFYLMRTPLYSLGMAGLAYYKKDYPTFEQYVDVPTIVDNGYNDLAPLYLSEKKVAAKKKAANAIAGAITRVFGAQAGAAVGNTLGEKVANDVVDGAVAAIEPQVKQKVVDGVTNKLKTFFTDLSEDQNKAQEVKEETPGKLSLDSIKEESNNNGVAVMNVVLANLRKEKLLIKLRMLQRADKQWKVIRVDNLNEVITKGPEFIK